jgi:hypothetical protein
LVGTAQRFQGEAEAVIFPAVQSFYNQPIDSTEIACQSACWVLTQIGLPEKDSHVWKAEDQLIANLPAAYHSRTSSRIMDLVLSGPKRSFQEIPARRCSTHLAIDQNPVSRPMLVKPETCRRICRNGALNLYPAANQL